jgi:endogenous inhibitor of DNA gyrase (YacG/DUF329 family)
MMSDDPDKPGPAAPAASQAASPVAACPICGKPRLPQFRPFCSKRCADVDLNRWLSGVYAVPVTEDDDEDGDAVDRNEEGGR